MKQFPITELARIIKAEPSGSTSVVISGVSTDSRTIKAGDCFFAIVGENFDGHNFVPDVFAGGAGCAVVSRDIDSGKFAGKSILKVEDTIKALGCLAREYRQQCNFKVVAVTGSVGKTTTRQIIYQVLSRYFRVAQSPKNFNNNIGLPLTLLGAGLKDEIIVAELGSNSPGEIGYLTRIACPDIAVVTNVHPAHLLGFGSIQTIIQEKLSISEGLRDGGTFIINGDIKDLAGTCRASGIKFTTFGRSEDCDVQAKEIDCKGFASTFTIDGIKISLPLPGPGNVENALAGWAVCSRLGLSAADFARGVEDMSAVSMRAELLQIGMVTVLSDCYNANPASMKNAMDILANLDPARKRRLVFICGDMAELGEQSKELHIQLGNSIAKAGVELLLTVGKFAEITAQAAKRGAKGSLQTKSFEDTLSACNNMEKFVKDSDIILVKGSRTAKLELAVEKLKELFGKKEVLRS